MFSMQPPDKTLCTQKLLTIPYRGQQVLASSQCWSGWSSSLASPLSFRGLFCGQPFFLLSLSLQEPLPPLPDLSHLSITWSATYRHSGNAPTTPRVTYLLGLLQTASVQVAMEPVCENWVSTQTGSTSDSVTSSHP